jgi:hypothetical protein
MSLAIYEFGRWTVVNVALVVFWYYIASRLVPPLRDAWPASVESERTPMTFPPLHRGIIIFAVICEVFLMVNSIALITSALTRYGWAK